MATWQSNSLASFASRWFLAVAAGLLLAGGAHGQTKNSCLECHSILADNLGVTEEKFSQDIHAQKGLTCASCHGKDAKGKRDVGSPNLTDAIWLYGSDKKAIIEGLTYGRAGGMPAWIGRLDPTTIKALAVYVHSLGGGE